MGYVPCYRRNPFLTHKLCPKPKDCYVAVCGLPEPRAHHAVVMARFAHECIEAMVLLTQQLEVSLGPETAELGMILVQANNHSIYHILNFFATGLRVGLHSGSVTAGGTYLSPVIVIDAYKDDTIYSSPWGQSSFSTLWRHS